MVLRVEAIDPGEVAEHLDRLVKSDLLRRSGTLGHMLEYLVAKALQGDGEHIKESVIAIELFHRPEDFDSKVDNIVRVHAHRLRRALDAWYVGEGSCEKLRFSIPKGSYTLHIERNDHGRDGTDEPIAAGGRATDREGLEDRNRATPGLAVLESVGGGSAGVAAPTDAPIAFRRNAVAIAVGFLLLGAAGMYAGLKLTGSLSPGPGPVQRATGGLSVLPLNALWGDIFRPGSNTVVSFTNPAFLRTNSPISRVYVTYKGPLNAAAGAEFKVTPGDPFVDKRSAALGPFFFNEAWTGVGEIMAVHKLTELATQSGFHFRMVRGRALTYDDMKGGNVIFLGSPWANDMQAKFNMGMTPFRCFGTEDIVNYEPQTGEPPAYYPELNSTTKELTASYGLFSVLPGLTAGTKIVSSSGIDDYATQAAMDLMTSPEGVRRLMHRFGTDERQMLPEYFQAVIRTEIIRGDPANASIVTVRALKLK